MKKQYFIALLVLFNSVLAAQTIVFSDAAFKAKLLQSEAGSTIARNLSDDYFAIDVNNNGEIEITEALQVAHLNIEGSSISSLIGIENFTNLISLQCSNNQISNLNIDNLTKITDLNCNNNIINTLSLTSAVNLENLYCQSNKLTLLNVTNLTNLVTLDCSYNQLTMLNLTNVTNLQSLICNSNSISTLNLKDLISLLTLECSRNMLTSLDLSTISNITSLNCNYNRLSTLDVSTLLDITSLDCTNNQLISLKVDGLTRLSSLNCNYNLLTALNVNTLSAITFLYCNNNNLQSIQIKGLMSLKVLDVSKNQISTLDINGLTTLQYLYCNNNKLVTLDATNQIALQFLFVYDNLLNSLFIKNSSSESSLIFSGNPNLNYICADESEIAFVQEEITNSGYSNCFVNSYCSFGPGGNYYTIEGHNKLDNNANGCDVLDVNFPNLKLTFADDATTTTFIPDSTGIYSYSVKGGSYIIVPVLENPSYYSISPASTSVTFPSEASPFQAPFCITPNGNHTDLEITILSLENARSNFDSTYKIVYKNKGTVTQSGVVNLTFDADASNLVTANPSVSLQNTSNLNWNFTNILPQETRTILVTFKVKPSVDKGYLLNFNVAITYTTDETPNDNSANLSQVVVNSLNSNDKICLDGNTISPTKVGDYLHYMIRFENSGSTNVQNIVLKDLIDPTKFDITTLEPLNGSHVFTTKISDNTTVEFIFQNINLPFDAGNNAGYVAFKIKTLPALVNGDEITNSASIYFDYYQPVATNIAATSVRALQIQEHDLANFFTIYPNPVRNILTIVDEYKTEISSITIYNTLGQLVQTFINTANTTSAIDVSQLRAGLYFIKINSDKGSATSKFIKE
ncbi:DUF7619 domain-containing protein [Flavobacterium franklandianum]|uniref:T9SS type A sorting domain-containing protein n=1 Tax=Flavobacterium franklandianum TaxID=2594430 RepID=A0A553CK57_9FLAO|nr:T9SS type A sorting domain-containing protein [Flavobacterium franklandianum]TRX20883.1 T9SS type A sorting domain-containing protein [Flavobacterium franklandianum]